jgi:hypothetical protein
MEPEAMTIREHLRRRSQVLFNLTTLAFVASLLGLLHKWPLTVTIYWWALSLGILVTFIVIGARMARCPRCSSKISHDADQCAGCGVDFGEPMAVRGPPPPSA